jgi:hypothetical protein
MTGDEWIDHDAGLRVSLSPGGFRYEAWRPEPTTDWREHLTPEEAARLEAIKVERLALSREQRRIFDRARKRAGRS